MSEVFVSYRTGDGEDAAVAIENELSHRFGSERIFRASKSIRPGELYPEALLRNARTCRILVAVIGPRWLDQTAEGRNRLQDPDDWVRREILEASASGALIIPVIMGKKTPSLAPKQLPKPLRFLAKCQSIRYDYQRVDESFEKLSRAILAWLPQLAERAPTELAPSSQQTPLGQSVQNTAQGNASVSALIGQAGTVTYNQHGGVGQINGGSWTSIGRVTGPVHTGTGSQHNTFPRGIARGGSEDDDE